jgi:hypothetical protein
MRTFRWLVLLAALALACAPAPRSTLGRPPTVEELAALWVEPAARRDTLFGPGGPSQVPRVDRAYRLVERKVGGFSPKIEVRDPEGVKWSVKFGDEAQSEVTSSRIVWALGYHQPPEYYVSRWQIEDEAGVRNMGPARFRPHLDDLDGRGSWSWHVNPFVDSSAFRGLIVLMMMLNSTDLKDENNEIYRVTAPGRGGRDLYAVRDLGASLGETGRIAPRRNNVEFFEKQAFITGVVHGFVRFEFHGRHQELMRHITPADVAWICGRLRGLTERQWHDAFRAGGYDDAIRDRYLRKIDEKVRQGLSLAGAPPR